MDPAYEMVEALETEITVGEKANKKTYGKRDQFAPELVYFSDCVLQNRRPEPSGLEGLEDIRIIEAMLKSAEINRPVSIQPSRIRRRPTLAQEIFRPPVQKAPELVHAEAPGGD